MSARPNRTPGYPWGSNRSELLNNPRLRQDVRNWINRALGSGRSVGIWLVEKTIELVLRSCTLTIQRKYDPTRGTPNFPFTAIARSRTRPYAKIQADYTDWIVANMVWGTVDQMRKRMNRIYKTFPAYLESTSGRQTEIDNAFKQFLENEFQGQLQNRLQGAGRQYTAGTWGFWDNKPV